MGFYYNQNEPPKQEKEPGGCLEALLITRAVFGVLALPMAMILGLFVVLGVMIVAFSIAWYFGILWLALIAAGTVAYARWERGHFGGHAG